MNSPLGWRRFFLGWAVWLLLARSPLGAQELAYDRYAPVYARELAAPSGWGQGLKHFLVYPFELIRWPVSQGLFYTEKYYLDKKVRWVYDTLQNHGVTPSLSVQGLTSFGGGATVDFMRLSRTKEHFPDSVTLGWIDFIGNEQFQAGAKAGLGRIAGTGFRGHGLVEYDKRRRENFYGIGPDSSAGDGAVFSMETTTLKTTLGYGSEPIYGADLVLAYRNINISGGRDGGKAQRGYLPTFGFDTTPGIRGDEILTVGSELVHDTRNQKENSSSGGRRRFSLTFNEGIDDSRACYMKYELEASQYFRLGSERRVFAARAYLETNDELGSGYVPFHQMAKLGGFGVDRRLSHTLRGFDFNRFFDDSAVLLNLEYRYTIWEYRDFKVDTVFFWDEGEVFGDFGNFRLKDLRESYGLGFRVSLANVVFFAFEIAHGDEGTNYYVKSHAPF